MDTKTQQAIKYFQDLRTKGIIYKCSNCNQTIIRLRKPLKCPFCKVNKDNLIEQK